MPVAIVIVPGPILVRPPPPLMLLFIVNESLRLNTNVPLLMVMGAVLASVMPASPLPICNVPVPLTMVGPP